ncbi:DNA-directed RNA polymerase subunit delta [Peloplasma aerotolerans]|jgi:DNA-directed RNA polymerase subunit delta|uniref:RNAP delta factor n=1 Tax=Peloplasma aerotolerans TaxID=3044389 RepID=A0AAW6U5T7_9MOLU|nr:DNA-directed RNA polymerase subunit delta [Mariniplasma sp. M4Ah]MDI6452180.1 DNA-directed RNA polymerase subunit delta [Mariniplasma sp. M4Ah]
MSDKMKSLAMLDVAEILLKDSKKPMTIQQLIQSVAEIKEISLEDVDKLTQLYMDITQSAKFVYCGDDQWDLKERNLELWDKDGFAFVQAEDIEEDVEEDLDFTEYTLEEEEEEVKVKVEKDDDEEDEEVDEEIKEEKAYIEIDLPTKSTDDDDVDDDVEIEFDDDYDEDDYNEIMDDYEDMYDE